MVIRSVDVFKLGGLATLPDNHARQQQIYILELTNNNMDNELLELRPWDLQIKTLDDGRELVELVPRLAWSEKFKKRCIELGVEHAPIRQNKEEVDNEVSEM